MQRPPPRPLPSSLAVMVTTSTPALRSAVLVRIVAVIADHHSGFVHDILPVVPLLALDAIYVASGGDHPEVHTDGVADGVDQALGLRRMPDPTAVPSSGRN